MPKVRFIAVAVKLRVGANDPEGGRQLTRYMIRKAIFRRFRERPG